MKTINDLLKTMCICLLFTHTVSAQQDYSAGYAAGSSITTGIKNTFVGFRTGQKTTSGSENSFFGRGAGWNNETGHDNVFLGVDAGYESTSTTESVLIGNMAGGASEDIFGSVFIGHKAGYTSKDYGFNVFIGHESGLSNTQGSSNIFLGASAGYHNLTGGENTIIGREAGFFNTTGYWNLIMGVRAGFENTSGSSNTYLGHSAGSSNEEGDENTFVGGYAGVGYINGSKNTSIGYLAGPQKDVDNATAIGYRAAVTASNSLVLGSIKNVNGAKANTNVGIGITAPQYQLHLSTNSAAKPGSSAWTVASDERLKQDIVDFTDGLSVVNQIKPVKYRYNGKAGLPQDKEYIGVVAQEVQKVAPYMVNSFTYQDNAGSEEEYLDFDATALTYILINAIKEQQEMLSEQQQKILALESKLAALRGGSDTSSGAINLGNTSSRLSQNVPNPYSQSTEIRYQVAEEAHSAFIKIYGITGEEIETFDISGQVEGKVVLSPESIPMGTYIYQLWVDGQLKDSKKLVQIR